jgi:hypothetical protein
VAEDENNIGMVDDDIELVNKDIPVISVIFIKKKAVLDSTILVNLCYIDEDVKDGVDTP